MSTDDRGAALFYEALMHADAARWARRIAATSSEQEDRRAGQRLAYYHEARVRAIAAACVATRPT